MGACQKEGIGRRAAQAEGHARGGIGMGYTQKDAQPERTSRIQEKS